MNTLSDYYLRESLFNDLGGKRVPHSSYFKEIMQMISESGVKAISTKQPTPTGHIFIPFGGCDISGVIASPEVRSLRERVNLRIEKYRTQILSDPLDTDTHWFVMPKDLKETSGGKTIGYQGERAGWSCYEDD